MNPVDVVVGAALATFWWAVLHPRWVRWRTRRTVGDSIVWVEPVDERGRAYPAGAIMFRSLPLNPEPGERVFKRGYPTLVTPAVLEYIRVTHV